MRERAILFSAPMVRALLAGTKTQTRRVVKPSSGPHTIEQVIATPDSLAAFIRHRCPYGQPGDRLWVRETWMDMLGTGIESYDPATRKQRRYAYGADTPAGSYGDECRKEYGLKWKPSIHMPRAACRLVLEVTELRVERLQAISEADARAEGCEGHRMDDDPFRDVEPVDEYRNLWESINGPGSWDTNPWVWAVSFRRLQP